MGILCNVLVEVKILVCIQMEIVQYLNSICEFLVIEYWLMNDVVNIINDLKSGWRDWITQQTEEGLEPKRLCFYPIGD